MLTLLPSRLGQRAGEGPSGRFCKKVQPKYKRFFYQEEGRKEETVF